MPALELQYGLGQDHAFFYDENHTAGCDVILGWHHSLDSLEVAHGSQSAAVFWAKLFWTLSHAHLTPRLTSPAERLFFPQGHPSASRTDSSRKKTFPPLFISLFDFALLSLNGKIITSPCSNVRHFIFHLWFMASISLLWHDWSSEERGADKRAALYFPKRINNSIPPQSSARRRAWWVMR